MSVLIAGFDSSLIDDGALRLCQGLRGDDDRVIAVHVLSGEPAQEMARARARLEAADADEHRVVIARSPARGLHDAALDAGADILAIGASRGGTLARLRPGGVAHSLLHGAPCAVLVVPPDLQALPTRVVVAYDGTYDAEVALTRAVKLARALDARLQIIGVCEPLLGLESWTLGTTSPEHQVQEVMAQRLAFAAEAAGMEAETRVVLGTAPKAVLDAADPRTDLLVLGSRGHGPLRSVALGSTGRYAVDHTAGAVLIAPRGDGVTASAAAIDTAGAGVPTL